MSEIDRLAGEIADTGKRLYQKNYICAGEGNISARLPDGGIIITPSNRNKGFLTAADMVICDAEGMRIEGAERQSSEVGLHATIYRNRPDISAVCHAHPVYATAFAAASIPLNRAILPEILLTLGATPLVPYALPGSDKLADNIVPYLDRYDSFLLERHGVVTIGKSCEEAFGRMEIVEKYANILYVARQIGQLKLLTSEETARLLEIAGRASLKTEIECR